jgi:hypothetical protein
MVRLGNLWAEGPWFAQARATPWLGGREQNCDGPTGQRFAQGERLARRADICSSLSTICSVMVVQVLQDDVMPSGFGIEEEPSMLNADYCCDER